jgi:ABC-type branched-subunit amino acid transport system ATPase component
MWQWVRDRAVKRLLPDLVDEPNKSSDDQRNLVVLYGRASGVHAEEGVIADLTVAPLAPSEVPALSIRDLSVELGGRRVVSNVDLVVQQYEIVGLIGSNGAGKSTLMNAVCGFLPASGEVEINGTRVDHLPPFQRARLGLGRSFQGAMLYPRLTVRECVQVALESRHRSEVLPSLLALPPAITMERWNRRAADELLGLLGLGDRAEQPSGILSTGTRRVVEFACLLAQQPTLVLLDEPMAGIAQRESEAFASLLVTVRRELNASMLIIEHDLPLITEISDRLYCLESGEVIAQGGADSVRNDPNVIASYLGTDERAIARSGPLAGSGTFAGAGKE